MHPRFRSPKPYYVRHMSDADVCIQRCGVYLLRSPELSQVPRKAGERFVLSFFPTPSSCLRVFVSSSSALLIDHPALDSTAGPVYLISPAHWLLIVLRPDGEWLHAAFPITENTCFHLILHVLHLSPYTSLHSLQHKSQRSFQSHYHPCHLHTPMQFAADTQNPDSVRQTATLVPSGHQSSRQHWNSV